MTLTLTSLNTPGLSDEERALINRLLKSLETRNHRNAERSAYYDQDRIIRGLGLDNRADAEMLKMVLGWVPKSVDYLSRRIICDGLVIPGQNLGDYGLDAYWRDNRLAIESSQIQTSALIHGVAFLVTTRGGVGEPEVLTTTKDALSGTGDWNPRLRRMDNFLSILQVNEDLEITELMLYLTGVNVHLKRDGIIFEVTRSNTGLPWVPVEPLPYRARTGRAMGSSRITASAMAIQDGALRALTRSEIAAKDYSDPIRALMNADMEQFMDEDGKPNAAFYALNHSRTLALPPNIQQLDDGLGLKDTVIPQSFQMIDGVDMAPYRSQLEMWALQFSAESLIPAEQLGVSTAGQPVSADAINAHNNGLILEAEGACREFEPAYSRSAITAYMIMNNISSYEDVPDEVKRISTVFRDPNTPSMAQQADAVLKQVQSGALPATSDVVLEKLGYTPAQIERIRQDRLRSQAASYLDTLGA